MNNTPVPSRADYEALAADRERLRKALAFAASVIKSGEPWTEQCERIIGGALRDGRDQR